MSRRAFLPLVALLACVTVGAAAQEADHPSNRPLVVGSDFGVAPWMMRGPNGAEGFGVCFEGVVEIAGCPQNQCSLGMK